MRHALALLAMLVPALGAAQAPGQVAFLNDRVNPLTVNATECNPILGATVTIRWSPLFLNGYTSIPAGGSWVVYGSNQAPVGDACFWGSDVMSNRSAGVVANLDLAGPATTAAIGTPALLAVAGKSCADEGATVFVCVQGVQGGVNNPVTNFAVATAAVTISTTRPPPPVVTSVVAADGALVVSWEPGAPTSLATADSQWVMLEAPDPLDPMTVHGSGRLTSSPARLGGLANGAVYEVRAIAVSSADNPSDPSNLVTGMPVASSTPADLDPWRPHPGSSGGCASGAAGLAGLALLAGALALRPRSGSRRRS
jgi:hypothetical protein